MDKPRVFIASSVENLGAAEAVNVNLEHECEPTLWHHAFSLASTSIEELVTKSSTMDFAVFIFAPDDLADIRGKSVNTTRDNVIFELGLFIGSIGRERCFIIKPRNCDLHIPSDLLGITTTDYDNERSDHDLSPAMTSACVKIKAVIKKLGMLPEVPKDLGAKIRTNMKEIAITERDLKNLLRLLKTHNIKPAPLEYIEIFDSQEEYEDVENSISIIKLMRAGYIDRSISKKVYSNEEYYSYTITSNGVELLLDHS